MVKGCKLRKSGLQPFFIDFVIQKKTRNILGWHIGVPSNFVIKLGELFFPLTEGGRDAKKDDDN
jgi:hypothetical protein